MNIFFEVLFPSHHLQLFPCLRLSPPLHHLDSPRAHTHECMHAGRTYKLIIKCMNEMHLCILLLYYIFPEPNRQQYRSINQSRNISKSISSTSLPVNRQTSHLKPCFVLLLKFYFSTTTISRRFNDKSCT